MSFTKVWLDVNTKTRMEFYTPKSKALWCRTTEPDKWGRHTITLLYSHRDWAELTKKIELFACETGLRDDYDFESWNLRPVRDFAIENFEDVHEGDMSISFSSKVDASERQKVPVYGPNNQLHESEILSGTDVVLKGSCKLWGFTDRETGEYKEGMSFNMEQLKWYETEGVE